ncbi:hypothetical protein DEO72_LG9g1038 [Vigna unguiculata]|uniref:Uncharacterized protein n=1 Tax=Vigna unguiculata TaxID=3917 RepID=A0A4D6N0S8_VIGUN|nr:hypothetical protein DEO72_LG9g1038 [Vigna unguiculata]
MEDTKKKMKCSGNEDKSKKSSKQWRFLVKMKSRSGAMVWKVARGDGGEGLNTQPFNHKAPTDGRPWCRRGRRSMEDTKKKMKCSGNEDKSKKSSKQWRFLVKMKSRSGAMVWKVARGDGGEG